MDSSCSIIDSKASFSASTDIPLNKAIGITSTVPVEIIFAAGYIPIDLNNIFICDEDPYGMVENAETMGFPRNTCSWIKGIYTATKNVGIKRIIGVVQGDCSHTNALLEVFQSEGIEVIPFSYPHKGNRSLLEAQLVELAKTLGVEFYKAQEMKARLDKVRSIVHEIDRLTWEEGKVSGEANHYWNVSTSDMMGNYELYEQKAAEFLKNAINRQPKKLETLNSKLETQIRIGFIGVPPICTDLYVFLESLGTHVVFNEVQRQFSMPYPTETLTEQYTRYTYPYSIFGRLEDIKSEVKKRNICGVINYVQSFCFRNIQEKIIRANIGVPMLTLECDRPGRLDGAMKTRIEAFIEMLKG
ncbi:MAG: 2-hydroxyacyl-CoA dehydratase [Planctomycetes bacterium]|nr:2-hydroxyacyl-CoA dehydratase [Planctomycetota bacterium]